MKGKITAILCLMMLSPILLALTHPVNAPNGNHYAWVDPDYVGYDPYYDAEITGYLEETNWDLTLSWTNWGGDPINISAIRLWFDWGKNYTYSFASPMQIMPGITQIFNIYNMTPPVEEAPERWGPHYYDIWIDHVNDTTQPYGELSPIYFSWGFDFVALSQDHLDCLNYMLKEELVELFFFSNITEVQVLAGKAWYEFELGGAIYEGGDFSEASAHLEAADQYVDDALDAWNEKGSAMEDANLANANAQANYYNGQGVYYNALGEASKTNAYGWLLFGLGWVFIGLGILVYGARRSKAAPPPS